MAYLYNKQRLKNVRKQLRSNMPKPEQTLWYYLKDKNLEGYKFRRQYSVGKYILDFYCPELRLALELDGDSHFASQLTRVYDQHREQFLAQQNIKVLRFTNTEISENLEAVINKISESLP